MLASILYLDFASLILYLYGMKRILVVDDEPDIVALVSYNLKKEGFGVVAVHEGGEALDIVKKKDFDLIILDLMLPGIHGMEVCRLLRSHQRTRDIPIIMLTAKGDEADRVRGLETGADDYIAKPFSPRELIARVKAVLRRSGERKRPEDIITVGDLRINKTTFAATRRNEIVNLSATEFRLLVHLAEHKGRVFSREQLLDAVWKDEAFVEPRTVDVHIRRLRAQIEDDPAEPSLIRTKRGIGYYLEVEA
jgi:phosphate regulon transcriptional regulator PhoB